MHSSRMHIACSSSCSGGLVLIPLNFPLGCGPGSDHPQFPPWVWAWIWSPSISPLGVGLDLIPLNFPIGCWPGSDPPQFPPWVWAWIWSPLISPLAVVPGPDPPQFPPWLWAWRRVLLDRGVSLVGGSPSMHWGRPPCGQTDTCKNITFANCGR